MGSRGDRSRVPHCLWGGRRPGGLRLAAPRTWPRRAKRKPGPAASVPAGEEGKRGRERVVPSHLPFPSGSSRASPPRPLPASPARGRRGPPPAGRLLRSLPVSAWGHQRLGGGGAGAPRAAQGQPGAGLRRKPEQTRFLRLSPRAMRGRLSAGRYTAGPAERPLSARRSAPGAAGHRPPVSCKFAESCRLGEARPSPRGFAHRPHQLGTTGNRAGAHPPPTGMSAPPGAALRGLVGGPAPSGPATPGSRVPRLACAPPRPGAPVTSRLSPRRSRSPRDAEDGPVFTGALAVHVWPRGPW